MLTIKIFWNNVSILDPGLTEYLSISFVRHTIKIDNCVKFILKCHKRWTYLLNNIDTKVIVYQNINGEVLAIPVFVRER